MSAVQTVQGPVEADELGVTLVHEHVRFRDEACVTVVLAAPGYPASPRSGDVIRGLDDVAKFFFLEAGGLQLTFELAGDFLQQNIIAEGAALSR